MKKTMKNKITIKHIFGNKKPTTPEEMEIYRHADWFAKHYAGLFARGAVLFEDEDHVIREDHLLKKVFDTHKLDPYLVQDGFNMDILKVIVEEVDKKYYDIIDEEFRLLNEF